MDTNAHNISPNYPHCTCILSATLKSTVTQLSPNAALWTRIHTDAQTHSPHSSRRGVTALICHALSLPFITDTIIQHTSDVISLQLEIHQAQGAFNCLVGAALPKPPPFSLPTLCFTSLRGVLLPGSRM